MSMSEVWDDPSRQQEFFTRLEALLNEYPELTTSNIDIEGFDPATPKVINGLLLMVNWQNLDGWGETFWTNPPGQHRFTSIGMAHHLVRMITS